MKAPRQVWVQSDHKGHLVFYCGRKKGGRYTAAQFNTDHSRAFVENWVRQNPKLELVEPPEKRLAQAMSDGLKANAAQRAEWARN